MMVYVQESSGVSRRGASLGEPLADVDWMVEMVADGAPADLIVEAYLEELSFGDLRSKAADVAKTGAAKVGQAYRGLSPEMQSLIKVAGMSAGLGLLALAMRWFGKVGSVANATKLDAEEQLTYKPIPVAAWRRGDELSKEAREREKNKPGSGEPALSALGKASTLLGARGYEDLAYLPVKSLAGGRLLVWSMAMKRYAKAELPPNLPKEYVRRHMAARRIVLKPLDGYSIYVNIGSRQMVYSLRMGGVILINAKDASLFARRDFV